MSDPKAGGVLVEILHAVDGKAIAIAVILIAVAAAAAVLRFGGPGPDDVLADHAEAERTRADWREANADPDREWSL